MEFDPPLAWLPSLDSAIARDPVIVSPTTPLVDAIALLSQSRIQTDPSCIQTDVLSVELTTSSVSLEPRQPSCVLVMQAQKLLGILTERDVVRLIAQGINFSESTIADVMVTPVITLPQRYLQDISAALFLFRRYRIRHLPVMDAQEQLLGVISHESLHAVLRPANLLRFRRVSDVMTQQVVSAPLTATVLQLAQLMAARRVSCVVIMQRDRQRDVEDSADGEGLESPVGIVTERDIVQFQALQIDMTTTQAQTVMSTPLFLLSPEDWLWTAHQEMLKRCVGRLVVSWNWGKGLGIVTQTSLLRIFDPLEMYKMIENLQQTVEQLNTEGSSGIQSPEIPVMLSMPSPPDLPSPPVVSELLAARDTLLAWLDSVSREVQQMLLNPEMSVEQRRSRLQSILNTLEQLYRAIDS
jgi:CBS domain-containing protein